MSCLSVVYRRKPLMWAVRFIKCGEIRRAMNLTVVERVEIK